MGTPMLPEEFRHATQIISRTTDTPLNGTDGRLALMALGLAGEAGEVADEVKKYLFHGKPLDRDHLVKEIGDVLWYVDRLLIWLGASMSDAMAANVRKLANRYPDGWDAAAQHFGWSTEATS